MPKSEKEFRASQGATFQERQRGIIGKGIDLALDVGGDIIEDIADIPSRVAAVPEFAFKEIFGSTDTAREREELRNKAIGGAFDIGSFVIPVGRIAKAAGIVGKGLAPKAARAGLTAARLSPLATPREIAGDPQERIKDIAQQTALGAAIPPAIEKFIAPVGKLVGQGAVQVGKRIKESIPKGVEDALVRFRERGNAKALSNAVLSLKKRKLAGQNVEGIKASLGEMGERAEGFLDELIPKLNLPESLTLEDLGSISFRGTFSKHNREVFRKALNSQDDALINKTKINALQSEAAEIEGEIRALLETAIEKGTTAVQDDARAIIPRLKNFSKEFRAARSEAGRSLAAFRKSFEGLGSIAKSVKGLQFSEDRAPLVKRALRGDFTPREFIRYWTTNIFPLGSPVRDIFGNTAVVLSDGTKAISADIYDFVEGGITGFNRSAALLKSVSNAFRPGRKARLGPTAAAVDSGFERTALGERLGGTDIIGPRIDRVLFAPAQAKSTVDRFFKRIGAESSLTFEALKEADKLGLVGTAKRGFVDDFIRNASDDVIEKAVKKGRAFGFNRRLSQLEERLAQNPAVRLLVTPFPRWNFQFTRFFAEHTPLDPEFWGKFRRGTVDAEDVVGFMGKMLTGAGAVAFTDRMIYDRVDFRNGQFVRDDGSRVSLRGVDPLPAVLGFNALLRGDSQNAIAMFQESSLAFTPLMAMSGILTELSNVFQAQRSGTISFPTAKREFVSFINNLFPGRGVMRAAERLVDPTFRSGFGQDIPGLSQFSEARIDPTTGEAAVPGVSLPGIGAIGTESAGPLGQRAAALLSEIPGVPRIDNKIRQSLTSLGFAVRRPRRMPMIGFEELLGLDDLFPAETDIPDQIRFEEIRGKIANKRLGRLVNSNLFQRDLARFEKSRNPDLQIKLRKKISAMQSKITKEAKRQFFRELRVKERAVRRLIEPERLRRSIQRR